MVRGNVRGLLLLATFSEDRFLYAFWSPLGSLLAPFWVPSGVIFSLLAAFWLRSCIFHVFWLQVRSEMIFYENFRTEYIFVDKPISKKSGTAARAHNKKEISKGIPSSQGPERNLAAGNLDPLRAACAQAC